MRRDEHGELSISLGRDGPQKALGAEFCGNATARDSIKDQVNVASK